MRRIHGKRGSTMLPQRLVDGYAAFLDGRFPHESERYQRLAQGGQSPKTMVVSCCDSRVSPEVIFDVGPGELFIVRNVANLVPPYAPDENYHGTSAALEFAVMALRVTDIVVLGHAQCGGIRASVAEDQEPLSPGDFIGRWMNMIAPAIEALGPRGAMPMNDYLRKLELASVATTLNNLRTFPCVQILEERGKLKLHGAFFGVATGVLSVLDEATGEFTPVFDRPGKVFACSPVG
jgi:carbonic anhydrase